MTFFRHANRLREMSVIAAVGVALLASTSTLVLAIGPYTGSYQIEQPDGSNITVRMYGTEDDVMEYDEEDYAVVPGGTSGSEYFYGEPDEEGDIVPSGVRAGDRAKRPKGLRKGLKRTGKAHERMGMGGTGGRLARKRGRGNNRAPRRRMQHVSMYEEWDEEIEAFHRRTMDWTGVKKNLVVPMRFKGHETRWVPTKENLNVLFNNIGPDPTYAPTGSVRDVFTVSSYGALDLQSGIMDWVQLSQTEAYYANGNRGFTSVTHEAMAEALDILETRGVDFSEYDTDNDGLIDAICFLHSGYGAEWGGNAEDGANFMDRIWSHQWSLYTIQDPATGSRGWTSPTHNVRVYNYHLSPAVYGTYPTNKPSVTERIGRIGVIAHETGHFLGLTNLYDGGDENPGNGIGSWGLMGNSWGFIGDQRCIPIFSPWSKMQLNWLTPNVIRESGSFSISPSYDTQDVYRIDAGFPNNEYLLIEYRKKMGFEHCMPPGVGGLAIWHIDDDTSSFNDQGWPGQAGWPDNGKHYRVSLLPADGKYDLEKFVNRGDGTDLFYPGNQNYLGPGTLSGTAVYPNTDSYQGGNIVETGIEIKNIGSPGATMSFDVVIPSPPTSPTLSPVAAPDPGDGSGSITCTETQSRVQIEITTDRYGSETSWVVEDQHTGDMIIGGTFADEIKSYHFDFCVERLSCYKFLIEDSNGDGLEAGGSWKVTYDGKVEGQLKEHYAFSQDGVDFGESCLLNAVNAGPTDIGLSGNYGIYAVMFDVVAKEDIVIRRLNKIHTFYIAAYNLKVYTKNGSHRGYEEDPSAWTCVQDSTLTGAGFKQYTHTNAVNFNTTVPVLKGTRQAFYIVLDEPNLVFTYSQNLTLGEVFATSSKMDVLVGTFNMPDFGAFATPAAFNGKIMLAVEETGPAGVSATVMASLSDKELPEETADSPTREVEAAIDEGRGATVPIIIDNPVEFKKN